MGVRSHECIGLRQDARIPDDGRHKKPRQHQHFHDDLRIAVKHVERGQDQPDADGKDHLHQQDERQEQHPRRQPHAQYHAVAKNTGSAMTKLIMFESTVASGSTSRESTLFYEVTAADDVPLRPRRSENMFQADAARIYTG